MRYFQIAVRTVTKIELGHLVLTRHKVVLLWDSPGRPLQGGQVCLRSRRKGGREPCKDTGKNTPDGQDYLYKDSEVG